MPAGLHVVMGSGGSPGHIVDGAGNVVQLHGADRSGTEYSCLSGAFFDGPVDQTAIDAMKAWHVNAVRVPLNEDCWLGINGV
ncbi:MAG: glycoside hydrolase family 5 protein, partial [Polyangiaceae bacterium]